MILAIWLYLIAARGRFWRAADRDDVSAVGGIAPGNWPSVTAVVPARDEADCVGQTVASLLRQNYPGEFNVVLVDDQSRDATAQVARDAAAALGATGRLTVLSGRTLPSGWTGKLWAQRQGVEFCENTPRPPDYILFTDADIVYAPDALQVLAAGANADGLVLTSLMAKLRCKSFAERMFVPAFIFFFQMLYPFAWANDPHNATAAAAGGCMLVRRETLRAAGGIEAIRDALIDDCTLAKTSQAARTNFAHADGSRALHPRLSESRRHPPHGLAHRLCAIALFAGPSRRHRPRTGADLSGAGGACAFRARRAAIHRHFRLDSDGLGVPPDAEILSSINALGPGIAGHRGDVYGVYARFRLSACPRPWRHVEGPRASECLKVFWNCMTDVSINGADDWRTGKGHRDENFPVASFSFIGAIAAPILAFYNFVRTADDIADHAALQPKEKLALLDRLEGGLLGTDTDDPVAVRLRDALAERNLAPKHAQDLIAAFKLDVTKLRYKTGTISSLLLAVGDAGRPLCLDVHGESRAVWPVNDALCAALQIINHVQDCKEDYRNLDRVYVPQDALAASGTTVEALGAARATPQLRDCLHKLAARTERLLARATTLLLRSTICGCPRSLGHQHAGASADADSDGARPAERARASWPRPLRPA